MLDKDVVNKYFHESPECNLQCLLAYLQDNKTETGTTAVEKWKQTVSKKLVWKFVDHDFFKHSVASKLVPAIQKIVPLVNESAKLSIADLKMDQYLSSPKAQLVRSALLSNLGKLHSNIRNLIERVGKATAEESSIARQSRSERDHALLAQLFERNALKEKQALLAELAKPSYQDDFLKRFGNSFCQICSYDDTFSDDDFFIYCEVI